MRKLTFRSRVSFRAKNHEKLVPRASGEGACGMEFLDGDWLGWMWCAATDVSLEWVLVESSV